MYKKLSSGFTIIELILVMAVIAVLSTFFVAYYPNAQKQARDTQRLSDLKQYQTALESYANKKNGFYISRTAAAGYAVTGGSSLCADLGLTGCPDDPKATNLYKYQTNGTNGTASATQYVLWARLERPTVVTYFVACSNGKSGEKVSFVVPSGGVCPL